ncbi:hypothetical protein NEUTE1DRAFT_50393 [Neurospora tetrasperma FGSC 2508]|uniref:Uncharacterized protein n=1 Tax=Neurospora tetrasperma (strain FGSC 2508 / ATCC MYA-4615 / P0657) TaxID=510951 RepID=F8MX61_NEUT8|nr:uncharacterized protein NEUTE1DRAFT_50393 [Neurospora tetrasperma FGSC 2508]EGO54332.1 hypothetical protein NEUTE1DRAFT_50393 [Neurospora tetrasperma FGSC 2508]EGZ68229.1 hypothetical protein NEUTE2DRAFT_74023 [Neurospora tetrasperma FGSC 2509]
MLRLASSIKYLVSHDYDYKKRGQVMLKDLSLAQSGNAIIGCRILGLLGSRTTCIAFISGLPKLLSKQSRIHDGKCPRPSRKEKLDAYSPLSAMPANPEKGQIAITNSEAPRRASVPSRWLFNIHGCHLKRLRSVMTAGKGTSVVNR